MSPNQVPAVSVADVASDARLVDVREEDEWRAGHAPAAVHLPMGELPARLAELPAERPLVVACRSGGRSARVTGWLLGQGRDAVNLDGGMLAWVAAGRPLSAESGAPPTVR